MRVQHISQHQLLFSKKKVSGNLLQNIYHHHINGDPKGKKSFETFQSEKKEAGKTP